MSRLTDTHRLIAAVLADQSLNTAEIAQRIGRPYWAARSTLIGMRRRREVVEIPARKRGVPYSYRLAGREPA